MIEYMLDTDICIYVMKSRSAALVERFEQQGERLSISTVALGELRFGAQKSTRPAENHAALDAFVRRLKVLAFGEDASRHYGALRAALEAAGTPCGAHDIQIGAHARSAGLAVVTNNRREFDRMPGVRVETWT